ncbi:hypothetical protein ONZ45_g11499 [Pleurotus djamor]|nr:hypothetical protein ONZ45_g11499 [Pleurotus djamor]
MESSIHHTFGPMFVGAMVTMMVYGITILQTYFYFCFYPKDSWRLKFLVFTLCVLDTTHVILMCLAMYHYLVTDFQLPLSTLSQMRIPQVSSYNIPSQLANGTSTLYISVAVNVLMAFIVQSFFSKRIFQLSTSRATYFLAIITAFFVFAHFCFGLETVILSWIKVRFDRLSENNYIAALPFAITAIMSDILIAASLCFLLGRNKSDFNEYVAVPLIFLGHAQTPFSTRSILNKLIIWAINRCILTSVVAIIETIVFIAIPHSLYYFAFDFIIGKRNDFTTVDPSIGFHVASAVSTGDPNNFNLRVRGSTDPERASPYLHEDGAESDLKQCRPIDFPVAEQCHHAQKRCPSSDTFLSINYLQTYFCLPSTLRPVGFIGLLLWLLFLFSTLGISASDFFTPNLATIAQLLGLDENVAGVTFLAFGNGSPDVFSTFSAMRTGSGSLAIGELIGAASFIVSVVVGSMCIIKPFQVNRAPFLRDVGVFSAAVGLLLAILSDNRIFFGEAVAMVGLYVFYVIVVVCQNWWERTQDKKRALEAQIRAEYDETPITTPYRDDPEPQQQQALAVPSPGRLRAISSPNPPRLQTDLPPRPYSRSPSPTLRHQHPRLPSFSLVGALEFRQVVNSLNTHAAGPQLSAFESPATPFAGGHYHAPAMSHSRTTSTGSQYRPRTSRSPSPTHSYDEENNPFDATLSVPLNDRSNPRLSFASSNYSHDAHLTRPPIPSISITPTPASPVISSYDTDTETLSTSRRGRYFSAFKRTIHILFPSLSDFGDKSVLGMLACIFAAPAVMLLTLTLPVVVTPYGCPESSPNGISAGPLIEFEEEGVTRALVAEEELKGATYEMDYNKWLMAVQCILGPLFSVAVLFNSNGHLFWILLGTAIAGAGAATLVLLMPEHGKHPIMQMARCSMGFFVAIVWIMAVADEVVNVLTTFGFIFGLSDAIIGLTIFAVGNSLADLVANMSVATFAPIMGFSACFGGPMLNILLGVGIAAQLEERGTVMVTLQSQGHCVSVTSLAMRRTRFVSRTTTRLIFDMTDLTYCYIHMTKRDLETLDTLETPEYIKGDISDDEMDFPAYMVPPNPDDSDILPSQVHPSYPYGNPTNPRHPAMKPRPPYDPTSKALFQDMGYDGGGVNGALRWKDLALEELLPIDEAKEEAIRAEQARKMASGSAPNQYQPAAAAPAQPVQEPTDIEDNDDDDENDENDEEEEEGETTDEEE